MSNGHDIKLKRQKAITQYGKPNKTGK